MSDEKSAVSRDTGRASYSRPAQVKLPEGYTMREGFLYRGDTLVSLITSGIVEAAARGFLHVDETEEYKTEWNLIGSMHRPEPPVFFAACTGGGRHERIGAEYGPYPSRLQSQCSV